MNKKQRRLYSSLALIAFVGDRAAAIKSAFGIWDKGRRGARKPENTSLDLRTLAKRAQCRCFIEVYSDDRECPIGTVRQQGSLYRMTASRYQLPRVIKNASSAVAKAASGGPLRFPCCVFRRERKQAAKVQKNLLSGFSAARILVNWKSAREPKETTLRRVVGNDVSRRARERASSVLRAYPWKDAQTFYSAYSWMIE